MERLESLTDGATALYESDAVAGVVNFIIRNDFEDLDVQLNSRTVDRFSQDDRQDGALRPVGSHDTVDAQYDVALDQFAGVTLPFGGFNLTGEGPLPWTSHDHVRVSWKTPCERRYR